MRAAGVRRSMRKRPGEEWNLLLETAVATESKYQQSVRDKVLMALARRYERNPMAFVVLPLQLMDSPLAREVVAQLRNEGYIEEKLRGTVRLTARGHIAFRATGPR